MGQSNHIQRDFSGGEISPKMLMRQDTDVYKKSAGVMTNFLPTPLGSAVRVPGTRFMRDLGNYKETRIMPYLTLANERSLLVLQDSTLKLIRNITDELDGDVLSTSNMTNVLVSGPETRAIVPYRKQSVKNFSFRRGLDDWVVSPNEYTSSNGDGPLGVFMSDTLDNTAMMVPRVFTESTDYAVCTMEGTAEIQASTDAITIDYNIRYPSNPSTGSGGFTFQIEISENSDYSSPLFDQTYNETEHPAAGGSFNPGNLSVATSGGFVGTLYIRMTATARATSDREYSNPHFAVFYFRIFGNAEAEITEADLVSPYTADDLPDVQYIQSPYDPKEMVFTHWRHRPYRFYFNSVGGQYVMEEIPFKNADGDNFIPPAWGADNYPAACGSYHGRLVLAGSQTFRTDLASNIATTAETVWCTEVGKWNRFSDTIVSDPEVNPDDSIEFTAIYRSPIQWVYGQKTLLVGALEYEYSASGEGIFSPGDLGVFLQSTHGSINVQPAGFGESVLFPADGGLRVRSMRYQQQDEGWISTDISLLNPEITAQGIKRMQRVRAPHQMCWCLTGNGNIAVWSQESGLAGWSRLRQQSGQVKDLCVLADNNGKDVPFVTVRRVINGVVKIYLEAYNDLESRAESVYVESHKVYDFETPTDTITGLEHLEGQVVIVSDPYRYVGFFTVTGGQIVLDDQAGGTTTMTTAYVGLQSRCFLRTLPPQKLDPGAAARFSSFSVRCLGSIRPIVNGERVPDRDPKDVLNLSNGVDLLNDIEVKTRGWDAYQPISIWEQVPFRVEVLGVYGNLKTGDL